MSHYIPQEDIYNAKSHFLSPSSSAPRKSPTKQSIHNRRSNSSLRSSSLGHVVDDDAANGRHSLAHELAAALMPEPSAGSKLLAEEFGIEYDEGAEGIDEEVHNAGGVQILIDDAHIPSFADELGTASSSHFHNSISLDPNDAPSGFDDVLGSSFTPKTERIQKVPEQDAMELLAQDLKSTDKFLEHLRHLDIDPGSSITQQPNLERIASDVIRRINETTRDRETQVRELLEYEREFRRIAGEVGGSEVLSHLEELTDVDGLLEDKLSQEVPRTDTRHQLETLAEEVSSPSHLNSNDWETDPDEHHLGDEDDDVESIASPTKDSFPTPPVVMGPATPAKTIPQLAHLRSFTTSLVSSLTTISEQAQVNGAATTEAGRKIRALKNKLGGWRTDWDSAERSRLRIDRWEAGILDNEMNGPTTATHLTVTKRIDGRRVVEEHLHAFELALADAALKTKAIMAS